MEKNGIFANPLSFFPKKDVQNSTNFGEGSYFLKGIPNVFNKAIAS